MIALRRARPALTAGTYQALAAQGDLLLYRRAHANDQVTVALNLGREPITVRLESMPPDARVLLSSNGDREGETIAGKIDLRGSEGLVIGATLPARRASS